MREELDTRVRIEVVAGCKELLINQVKSSWHVMLGEQPTQISHLTELT